MSDIHITELKKFCGIDPERPHLLEPFEVDGMTVATNGHVLVAIPLISGTVPCCVSSFPDQVRSIFEMFPDDGFIECPHVDLPVLVGCYACNGTGKAHFDKCRECGGEGEVSFHNAYHTYEDTCKTCDGEGGYHMVGGDEDCQRCGGIGKSERDSQHHPITLDGVMVNPVYFSLLRLQDAHIFVNKERRTIFAKNGDTKMVAMGMLS